MQAISTIGEDDNRGPELLAVIWVFTVLALVVVVAKFYTKVKILHDLGLDDLFIILSTLD